MSEVNGISQCELPLRGNRKARIAIRIMSDIGQRSLRHRVLVIVVSLGGRLSTVVPRVAMEGVERFPRRLAVAASFSLFLFFS